MQNINIKNSQDAIKAYSDSANAYSGTKMKTASVDQLDAFEKVGQVQYDRNSSVDTNAQTVMDNFNEYRKDMQEKAKQEQQEFKTRSVRQFYIFINDAGRHCEYAAPCPGVKGIIHLLTLFNNNIPL